MKITSPILLATFALVALLSIVATSAYAGDLKDLFNRAAQAEKVIYQVETTTDIMFSLISEDYKKKYGTEAYYNVVFENGKCVACGRKKELK